MRERKEKSPYLVFLISLISPPNVICFSVELTLLCSYVIIRNQRPASIDSVRPKCLMIIKTAVGLVTRMPNIRQKTASGIGPTPVANGIWLTSNKAHEGLSTDITLLVCCYLPVV